MHCFKVIFGELQKLLFGEAFPQKGYVAPVRSFLLNQGGDFVPENQRQAERFMLVALFGGEYVNHPLQVVYFSSPRGENQAELFVYARKRYRLAVLFVLPARHDVCPAEAGECVEKREDRSSAELEMHESGVIVNMRDVDERAFRIERVGEFL